MSYSVRYQVNLEDIPEDARPEIVRTFQQISEVVGTVPLTSPFWSSMKESVLQVDVKGWRLAYRIELKGQLIRVIEAQKL